MTAKQIAPYGSWKSPISADLIVSNMVRMGKVCLDGENVYWLETRPEEGGRDMVCCLAGSSKNDSKPIDVTPLPFNARTRVHEFGGGGFTAVDDCVFFTDLQDQRIYMQKRNKDNTFSAPIALTPAPDSPGRHRRFADIALDKNHKRLIAVEEDHRLSDDHATASIVAIPLPGKDSEITTLVSGADFFTSPRVNASGTKLAWISWNHPNMPWYGTELWLADINADGSLSNKTLVAGGKTESIIQPEWSPDDQLYFISDRSGWWNIFHFSANAKVEQVMKAEVECGVPHLYFGHTTYGFASGDRIICTFARTGVWFLAEVNVRTGELTEIESPFQEITFLKVNNQKAVFRGGSPDVPISIIEFDLATHGFSFIKKSFQLEGSSADLVQTCFSRPQTIEFPTANGKTSHAFFYPPSNQNYEAPSGEKPPLLVKIHGGPHNQTFNTLDLTIQYWTSRGFALVDVNYGGSSGFGREYRERLKGNWGVVDNQDAANAAQVLVEQGSADAKRLAITGMSARGYATICGVTFHDIFAGGSAHCGISDMEGMANVFHRFQSKFLSSMIGAFPEEKEVYRKRSAINFVEQINCPLMLLHGALDTIVPIEQSEILVRKLDELRKPHYYLKFDDEPHVFRKAGNVKSALESELAFYCQIFGIHPSDKLMDIEIRHLN